MNENGLRKHVISYWMEKSDESIASARSEAAAGRLTFAVNRAYYACFYAATGVLLKEKRSFKKHSGVRAALHRVLVKPGRLAQAWGRFYDRVFENRQQSDYLELVRFEAGQVAELIELAEGFVREMRRLLQEVV